MNTIFIIYLEFQESVSTYKKSAGKYKLSSQNELSSIND